MLYKGHVVSAQWTSLWRTFVSFLRYFWTKWLTTSDNDIGRLSQTPLFRLFINHFFLFPVVLKPGILLEVAIYGSGLSVLVFFYHVMFAWPDPIPRRIILIILPRGLWRTGPQQVVWTAKSSSFARRYSRAEASTLLMANMLQNFNHVMGYLDKLENKVMYVVEKKV